MNIKWFGNSTHPLISMSARQCRMRKIYLLLILQDECALAFNPCFSYEYLKWVENSTHPLVQCSI